MMDNKFRDRKYTIAVFFALADTVGLYFNYMDANTYVLAQGVILGMYATANVLGKK